MYTALATLPDISFAVAALCRYNSEPFTSPLTAANRVLQYLQFTANFRLHFSSSSSTGSDDWLTGYTDLDWANDSADRKSQGGHIFFISNVAVSWQLWKEDAIVMSTLGAQSITCSEGLHEAKWLLQLHQDMHGKDTSPLPINCDN